MINLPTPHNGGYDYTKKLLEDLPCQFDQKPKIKALNEVLGKQLQQLYIFFLALSTKRHFPFAEGLQLDGVGDIVVLSRLQAIITAGLADLDVEMDDLFYRFMLSWKMFLNTSWARYSEVHHIITSLWQYSPMLYEEDKALPATIIFKTPWLSLNQWLDFRILYIAVQAKAAGVQIIIKVYIRHNLQDIGVVVAAQNRIKVFHAHSSLRRPSTHSPIGLIPCAALLMCLKHRLVANKRPFIIAPHHIIFKPVICTKIIHRHSYQTKIY